MQKLKKHKHHRRLLITDHIFKNYLKTLKPFNTSLQVIVLKCVSLAPFNMLVLLQLVFFILAV